MNEHFTTTGKRRTAHLPNHKVDLSTKLNRLKLAWRSKENTNPNVTIHNVKKPLNLTPMQTKAKQLINKQQLPKRPPSQHKTKQRQAPTATKHDTFMERIAKKHPEILANNPPPMHFYLANRPFEAGNASYIEDRNRLEGCQQLFFNLTLKYNKKKKMLVNKNTNVH